MVIKDVYLQEQKPSPANTLFSFAPPGDRLLASFIDFILHVPLFTLFSSILLYRMNVLKLTIGTTSEKMAVFAQLIWVFAIGTIILQGIYFKLWKKTPGMRLFKLELRNLRAGELTWGQCLLRSSMWLLQGLALGVPLLEIFSHPKRYGLHDRISETEMATKKVWGTISPLPTERSTVQLIYSCTLMLMLGWGTAFFSTVQKNISDGSMALAEWREQGLLCHQVDEVSSYSDVDLTDVHKRIDFTLSLFFLEQIDSECLRKEVDFALLKEVDGALPWVGRALLLPAYSSERQDYFARACGEDSNWCQKALYRERSSPKEAKQILNQKVSSLIMNKSLALQTANLLLYNRMGAADQASRLVDSLQANGIRATGLVLEHLKTVSRTNPDRMPSVLQILKSVMVEKDFLQVNADLCLRQLESGCNSKSETCEYLQAILPKFKDQAADLTIGRALFKSAICKKDLAENMEYWTLISDEGLQRLVTMVYQLEKGERTDAILMRLRNFVKNEVYSMDLRLDALQILMGYSSLNDDWTLAKTLWSELDWTHADYLSASEWFLREGRRTGHQKLLLTFKDSFATMPGLRFDWDLLTERQSNRLPANTGESKE